MEIPEHILRCARELRSTQTDAEAFLWQLLRNRRFCGYKFRRQHPVGRYVLDFYCHEARLAIELDGSGHGEAGQAEYDGERSRDLAGAGIAVIRFWNDAVFKNTDSVLTSILTELEERCPSPGAPRHPLPGGEG